MIYEFVTPSDAITFVAPDNKIAYATAVFHGNGKAACKDEEGESLPTMLMFAKDPDKIMEKYLGEPMNTFVEKNLKQIAECFLSFAYGSIEDRKTYDDCIAAITNVEKLKEFKKKHEDRNRTSMSQWVKSAWETGEAILKKLKQEKK